MVGNVDMLLVAQLSTWGFTRILRVRVYVQVSLLLVVLVVVVLVVVVVLEVTARTIVF